MQSLTLPVPPWPFLSMRWPAKAHRPDSLSFEISGERLVGGIRAGDYHFIVMQDNDTEERYWRPTLRDEPVEDVDLPEATVRHLLAILDSYVSSLDETVDLWHQNLATLNGYLLRAQRDTASGIAWRLPIPDGWNEVTVPLITDHFPPLPEWPLQSVPLPDDLKMVRRGFEFNSDERHYALRANSVLTWPTDDPSDARRVSVSEAEVALLRAWVREYRPWEDQALHFMLDCLDPVIHAANTNLPLM